MASQELLDTIRQKQASGHSEEDILKDLTSKGSSAEDVNGAFAILKIQTGPFALRSQTQYSSVQRAPAHSKTSIFLQLVLIAVVIVSAPGAYGLMTRVIIPATKGQPVKASDSLKDYSLLGIAPQIPVAAHSAVSPSTYVSPSVPRISSNTGAPAPAVSSAPSPAPASTPVSTSVLGTIISTVTNTVSSVTGTSDTNTQTTTVTPPAPTPTPTPTPDPTPTPISNKPPVVLPVVPVTPTVTDPTFVYVCPDATAGTHTGADWTNAYLDLPKSLVRGDTYYLCGSGTEYAIHTFSDAASGSTLITVKKATQSNHGTDTGWISSYGTGTATFPMFNYTTPYYVLDGSTGGGPGNWTSGFGITVTQTNPVCNGFHMLFQLTNTVSNLTIEHVNAYAGDITFPMRGINGTTGGTGFTFRDNYLHNLFGAAFYLNNWSNVLIEDNAIDGVKSTGYTDPICPNYHAEGVSSQGTNDNWTFRNNIWNDINGTGVFAGVNLGISTNWSIYGNIFSDSVSTIYYYHTGNDLQEMDNLQFYNNDVVNMKNSSVGALHIEQGTNNLVYNNIWYNNQSNGFGFFGVTHANDYFSKNVRTSGVPTPVDENPGAALNDTNAQIGSSTDPFVRSGTDVFTSDYHLSAPLNPGVSLGSPYNVDAYGVTRGADGTYDRGAYEYQGQVSIAPVVSHTSLLASVGVFASWLRTFLANLF
ncbi:MAG: hypothetical protein JWM39_453 [Parcubacteria group bacterium]|nr:hypothetical protein [Parcubacteria group bacterium]